jgi:aspartate kinase
VVQKYGGSSVADLERLRGVAARIAATREEGAAVVAVVSAMGNTTNELIRLARAVTASPDRRELDMLISTGERISVALLCMALQEIGVPARSLTGSQSGIITDEAHADANVVAVRPDRVLQHLRAGEVVVVAGFQGVSREREVTTLGRGGSDTTAVVLAAALGAAWCEICSDVDGVWTADPRVVPEARKLDVIGLDAGLALARGGAKVLFEDAVRYARDHGVEIVASSTFGPGSGTRLTAEPAADAVAVTGDDQVVSVTLPPQQAEDWVATVRAAGGRVRRRVGDRLYVDVRNAHGGLGVPCVPTALVTAAASALGEDAAAGLAIGAALASAGVPVLACGAEADAQWVEVAVGDLPVATRTVHAAVTATRATLGAT